MAVLHAFSPNLPRTLGDKTVFKYREDCSLNTSYYSRKLASFCKDPEVYQGLLPLGLKLSLLSENPFGSHLALFSRYPELGVPLAQQVKDSALSLLGRGFQSWPQKFHMLGVGAHAGGGGLKKKKRQKPEMSRMTQKGRLQIFFPCLCSFSVALRGLWRRDISTVRKGQRGSQQTRKVPSFLFHKVWSLT